MLQREAKQARRRHAGTVISSACLGRLEALAEGAVRGQPDLAERLFDEIGRARIVPEHRLPRNVVTIGRPVTYRDETTGREMTVTPVYPEDANIALGRVSVMTPIGVALIGLSEGASLDWTTQDGKRRVLTVILVEGE